MAALVGKKVVIVGGSSGVGLGVAEAARSKGLRCSSSDVRPKG